MLLVIYVMLTLKYLHVSSLVVKTSMTSHYSLKLIENGFMHPWVYDRDEFKDVDD